MENISTKIQILATKIYFSKKNTWEACKILLYSNAVGYVPCEKILGPYSRNPSLWQQYHV